MGSHHAFGVSHTHIRDIEDGKSVPSFEMVIKFLIAYGIDIEMFLRETGYLSSRVEPEGLGAARRVPVISWAQAGNWQELCANFQYGGHEEYVETDSKGIFALRVRGDSMETEFLEGDIIIVINPYLKPEHNDYHEYKELSLWQASYLSCRHMYPYHANRHRLI